MNGEPYLRPLLGSDFPRASDADIAAASAERAREEQAFLRSLGTPRREQQLPQLKEPILPQDFAAKLAALDEAIFNRGIAVDSDRLLSLGRERFQQLLAADGKVPRNSLGAGIDCTRFESVQQALSAFESSAVERRKTSEVVSGSGKEREQVRRIGGWQDLWKASGERAEVLHDLYDFNDKFAALCFGQSMLARLKDGKVQSHFFLGGKGRRVELFNDWLKCLGTHTSVRLVEPLFSLMAWLSGERAQTPSTLELAKDFFSQRVPSPSQLRLVRALVDAFALGYRDEWQLWEFVGRSTRTAHERERLMTFRKALAARFPRIASRHEQLRVAFYRDIDAGDVRYAHREVDVRAHRAFIDLNVQQLLDCSSALLALGVEETFSGAVVARFEGSVLTQGRHKLADKSASIARRLAAAFPRSTFELQFEELQR